MRFIEETEAAWSAEQLAAAEREIEEQKREWEENRLAALRKEEERRKGNAEEDSEMLTFSREDSTNQVRTKKSRRRRGKSFVAHGKDSSVSGRLDDSSVRVKRTRSFSEKLKSDTEEKCDDEIKGRRTKRNSVTDCDKVEPKKLNVDAKTNKRIRGKSISQDDCKLVKSKCDGKKRRCRRKTVNCDTTPTTITTETSDLQEKQEIKQEIDDSVDNKESDTPNEIVDCVNQGIKTPEAGETTAGIEVDKDVDIETVEEKLTPVRNNNSLIESMSQKLAYKMSTPKNNNLVDPTIENLDLLSNDLNNHVENSDKSDIENIDNESELSSSSSDDNLPLKSPKIIANKVDEDSPRTRSHGRVKINLWTLDVSPVLPGVKPVGRNNMPFLKSKNNKPKIVNRCDNGKRSLKAQTDKSSDIIVCPETQKERNMIENCIKNEVSVLVTDIAASETTVVNSVLTSLNPETKVSNVDTKLPNVDTNVSDADTKVSNVDMADTKVSDDETKVSKADMKVSDADPNVLNVDMADTKVSTADAKVSNSDVNISNADSIVSNSDMDVSNSDINLSNSDAKVSNSEVKLSYSAKKAVKKIRTLRLKKTNQKDTLDNWLKTGESRKRKMSLESDSESPKKVLKSTNESKDLEKCNENCSENISGNKLDVSDAEIIAQIENDSATENKSAARKRCESDNEAGRKSKKLGRPRKHNVSDSETNKKKNISDDEENSDSETNRKIMTTLTKEMNDKKNSPERKIKTRLRRSFDINKKEDSSESKNCLTRKSSIDENELLKSVVRLTRIDSLTPPIEEKNPESDPKLKKVDENAKNDNEPLKSVIKLTRIDEIFPEKCPIKKLKQINRLVNYTDSESDNSEDSNSALFAKYSAKLRSETKVASSDDSDLETIKNTTNKDRGVLNDVESKRSIRSTRNLQILQVDGHRRDKFDSSNGAIT